MHHFCFFSDISIHSLRMEGDSKENIVSSPFRKFQSTPSAWRETLLLPFFLFSRSHFNPLPPHGGRPVLTSILRSNPAFQSTPSAWRETSFSIKLSSDLIFQSTPSAWRETARQQIHAFLAVQFQSTPSAWRETWCFFLCHYDPEYFNPLPPHGGRQLRKAFILTGEKHFNPLPPHGGRRTRWRQSAETSRHFNPLPPHGGRQSSLNIFCIFNRHFNPLPPHGGRLLSSSS